MKEDKELIKECREAWDALGWFRRSRRRCKDFAYGRQWDDPVRLPSGRIVSEERQMIESGRMPVTNNLIGRMIKQMVGYYRHLSSGGAEEGVSLRGGHDRLGEADARGLEEFLISGMALQRVKRHGEEWLPGGDVSNRSPERVFFRRFTEPDGADARFVGMLHDIPLNTLVERFGYRDPATVGRIIENYRKASAPGVPCMAAEVDFPHPDIPDLCRVVEVWRRRLVGVMRVYDRDSGDYVEGEYSAEAEERLRMLNEGRTARGRSPLMDHVRQQERWEQTWLLPDGTVLDSCLAAPGEALPIVMRLYPMVDGEVHSMVETVIDQQKFVNRLVGLLDEILGASAKGAVLYPVDQLPDGMTWKELRRLWSSPSAILPFKRTSRSIQPRQLAGGGSCAGATELLKTQLSLFDDISGSGGIFSDGGRQAAGADMARLQRDGAAIAMLDILSAFREFTARRDRVMGIRC